jgi:hypothetical protein
MRRAANIVQQVVVDAAGGRGLRKQVVGVGRRRHGGEVAVEHLRFGRIVVLETEAPNMLGNLR